MASDKGPLAMLPIPSQHGRILMSAAPADMREGHNSLQGLVLAAGEDPYCGDIFVFISKKRDRAKILTYDGGGLVLWYKRLEQDLFRHPHRSENNVVLESTSLTMLLDGTDLQDLERPEKRSREKSETERKSNRDARKKLPVLEFVVTVPDDQIAAE